MNRDLDPDNEQVQDVPETVHPLNENRDDNVSESSTPVDINHFVGLVNGLTITPIGGMEVDEDGGVNITSDWEEV